MNNQHPSSIRFFVLGDSHAKHIGPNFSTSSYSLITRSIRGLKWIDNYNQNLCVYALLSLPEIQSYLSQANAILFLVGTNSVRIFPATKIISQIQQIILFVQQNYPHLNQHEKIFIPLTFPCFKTTSRFPTETSLISNINSYNEQLQLLSSQMNFNIINFDITPADLANDHMHIHSDELIRNSIIKHFDQVIQTISTRTTTIGSNPSLPSTSSSNRSREALQARNKKRHEKRKIKQQQHQIKRKIHHQWTNAEIKQYLDSLHIQYGYIPPVYGNILRIQFNTQEDQDFADKHLGMDIFNENHYQEFVNKS
jgi:hypothetical protein